MTDCNQVDFSPDHDQADDHLADSPSGLEFRLDLPQVETPTGPPRPTCSRRRSGSPRASLNPSAANGVGPAAPKRSATWGLVTRGSSSTTRGRPDHLYTLSHGADDAVTASAPRAEFVAALEALPGLANNVSVDGNPGELDGHLRRALAARTSRR